MAKNNRDYAVIVGIKDYPAFDGAGALKGPENDARAFYSWIVSPQGGNLPKKNTTLIVSSKFKPPFPCVEKARPIAHEIQRAFEKLQNIAEQNSRKGNGLQTGRRLYIYFAGHGFDPRGEGTQTALLMANSTRDRVGPLYHILGQYTANWFFKARYFEEILLFMDCCREVEQVAALNMSFKEIIEPGAVDEVKWFHGFATKWSRLSREKDINGVRRGVFTVTLIKGLEGDACNPDTGEITTQTLKSYLLENMEKLLDEEDLIDGSVAKKPDFDDHPRDGKGFLLAKVSVPTYRVTIRVPPEAVGKKAEILADKSFAPVKTEARVTDPWTVRLTRGKYLAQILSQGLQEVVNVNGAGDIDVSLSHKE